MPNIIEFLKIALATAHSCHIVKSVPDTKEMKINEYYLFQHGGHWELQYKKVRQVWGVRERQFHLVNGLENLNAALAKLDSKAKDNSVAVDEVMKIISAFHLHDKKAIANKIKTSLAHHDHGFISRMFSDLNNPFLTRRENEKLTGEYRNLLKSLTKEYKDLLKKFKIAEDGFPELDLTHSDAKDFNRKVDKFELWLNKILEEGKRELFDNNGAVKSEIIYLLINSMRITPAEVNELIADFKEDTARQGMMSAYVSLIFQNIFKAVPQDFMNEIPDMLKSLTSKLITSNSKIELTKSEVENEASGSSDEKFMPNIEEVDINALTTQYQSAAAKLNETIMELADEILALLTKPEHIEIVFNAIRRVNNTTSSASSASSPNPFAELIETLNKENYNDENQVFDTAMLLASIFVGKDNIFTKRKNIWEEIGATDDLARRKCGQEALEFFKNLSLPFIEPNSNSAPTSAIASRK